MLIYVVLSIEHEPQHAWSSWNKAVEKALEEHWVDGNLIEVMDVDSGEEGEPMGVTNFLKRYWLSLIDDDRRFTATGLDSDTRSEYPGFMNNFDRFFKRFMGLFAVLWVAVILLSLTVAGAAVWGIVKVVLHFT